MIRATRVHTILQSFGSDGESFQKSPRAWGLLHKFSALCLTILCSTAGGASPSSSLIVGSRVYMGTLQGAPSNGYQVRNGLIGDVNGDGAPDVILGNGFAPPIIFLNNGTASPFQGVPGSFVSPPPDLGVPFPAEWGPAALADVNADGHPDIIVSGFNALINTPNIIYLNDGTSVPFNGVSGIAIGAQDDATGLALADVNGDGFVDLAVANTNQVPSRLYLTKGAPLTSGTYSTVQIGSDLGYGQAIKIADVNGDGKPDIILAYDNITAVPSGISIYFNNGTSDPFANVAPARLLVGQSVSTIEVADLNKDGKIDLIASASSNNNRVLDIYLNSGSPSQPFAEPQALQSDNNLGNGWCFQISAADVNGDTLPDVLITCNAPAGTAIAAIYLNNGTANPFADVSPVDIPATQQGSYSPSIAVGTLVKNGPPDVLLTAGQEPGLASYSPLILDQNPIAQNDTAVIAVNKSIQINVVANDSAGPGQSLNASSVTITKAPQQATASVNSIDGSISYAPTAGYSGTDSFQYTVRDGLGAVSNVASVSVSVQPPPVAANDTATIQANRNVIINVLANDKSAGGTVDPASIKIVGAPAHGTASVASGEVVYTPTMGYSGLDTLQYSVQDNLGTESNVAAVSIQVTAVTPPTSEGGSGGYGGSGGGGGGGIGVLDIVAVAGFVLARVLWTNRRLGPLRQTMHS